MKPSFLSLLIVVSIMVSCSTSKEGSSSVESSDTVVNLLVGTYTGDGSEGIYQLKFDAESGELSDLKLLAKTSNPSFLAIDDSSKYIFSVSEDEEGSISSWEWKNKDTLVLINQVPSFGKHPCYLDSKSGMVAVANYSSGNGGIFAVTSNGKLTKAFSEFQHYGSGANPDRQGEPHAHFSQFSKEGSSLYVIDLGIDQVLRYPVRDNRLGAASTAMVVEAGDGPRHLEFHPTKDLVFVVTELNSMIMSASVDQESGKFSLIDRKSTLPEGFDGKSYCADIHVSPDGQFVYVSNRGHQSIAIFQIKEDGSLEMLGTEDVRGDWPRNFVISPDGAFLLVANQNSDNITVFNRDTETGLLKFTGNEIKMSHPVCLKF